MKCVYMVCVWLSPAPQVSTSEAEVRLPPTRGQTAHLPTAMALACSLSGGKRARRCVYSNVTLRNVGGTRTLRRSLSLFRLRSLSPGRDEAPPATSSCALRECVHCSIYRYSSSLPSTASILPRASRPPPHAPKAPPSPPSRPATLGLQLRPRRGPWPASPPLWAVCY